MNGDDRAAIGRVVYEYLSRRFQGDFISIDKVLEDNPGLPALQSHLKQAADVHRNYLSRAIGHYELKGTIGRGGFGEVYYAVNVHTEFRSNKCALKLVRSDGVAELSGIRDYMQKNIRHQNLVPVNHVDKVGQRYFFYTMPLADNLNATLGVNPKNYRAKTLTSMLNHRATVNRHIDSSENSCSIAEVRDIGIAIASGLECLHAHDLVHRDVKPANILCIGNVWHLGDVGLLAGLGRLRGECGSPGYRPPEGNPTNDPSKAKKDDVYALGLSLFQAMTGFDPYQAVEALDSADFSTFSKAARPLLNILRRACALNLEMRYASATDFLRDLRQLSPGLPKKASGFSRVWRVLQAWLAKLTRLLGIKK